VSTKDSLGPGSRVITSIASMCVLLLCVGCTTNDSHARWDDGAMELPREFLVYASHSDAARTDYDIWRVCADGSQEASLVVLPGNQWFVSVAPDGNALIYTDNVDGKPDLWQKPFAGGEAVNLTHHPASDSSPAYSPDGKRVAFASDRDHEKPEIYVLALDTGDTTRLTDNAWYDSGPSWSPDGKTIFFTRYFPPEAGHDSGAGEVFSIEVESGVERQLTQLGGYCGGIDCSPDSRAVAFHRVADGGSEIWLMDADGSNPRAITDTYVDEYSPVWSPNGRWIAFVAGTEHDGRGTFDLWLMRPDGSRRQMVSSARNTQMNPVWRRGDNFCR